MYDSFYGFRERPFTLLPDPDFLFLDKKHRAALDMLESAVAGRSGFCVISGEIGAGKTTLIRELLNRLDETVCVGLVSNTHPSFGELLQWIMAAYGLPDADGDALELHKRFIEFVLQQYAQNRHTLLIIDEAQNLSVQALEELRMLSNVNSGRDSILQIILVGQHQLRDRLLQPELTRFSRRVALSYHLEELAPDETCRYIQHRLAHAGGDPELFSTDACQAVYRLSGGVPRLINRLCDLSLVYGCSAESRVIGAELVERVAAEQRMSALRDIPQVERGPAQTAEMPASEAASVPQASGKEAALSAAAAVAVEQVDDVPVPADTAASGVRPALMADRKAPAVQGETTGVSQSELHQLVVNAEQSQQHAGGERSALWLLLVIIAMAGGTGWLIGDFQGAGRPDGPIVATERAASPAATAPPVAETESVVPPVAEDAPQQKVPAAPVVDSAQALQNTVDKDRAEEDAAVKKAAQAEAEKQKQQRAAALKREAEATARLKRESARLERERLAAEQLLAKQRAARQALERQAEQERRKLAKAREAAAKLAEERSRNGAALSVAPPVTSSPAQDPGPPARSRAGFETTLPSAYDEDDGDAIVMETKAQPGGAPVTLPAAYDEDDGDAIVMETRARLAGESAKPAAVEASAAAGTDAVVAPAPVQEQEEAVEFAANPCRGPSARFLSTCR
ncbi:MAG: AAA family ATPase [Thiogranum sp.]